MYENTKEMVKSRSTGSGNYECPSKFNYFSIPFFMFQAHHHQAAMP